MFCPLDVGFILSPGLVKFAAQTGKLVKKYSVIEESHVTKVVLLADCGIFEQHIIRFPCFIRNRATASHIIEFDEMSIVVQTVFVL